MPTPRNRVPGAATEPALEPVIHDHRVSFMPAGDLVFAACSCGWIDCAANVGVLSMKAAAHGIGRSAA